MEIAYSKESHIETKGNYSDVNILLTVARWMEGFFLIIKNNLRLALHKASKESACAEWEWFTLGIINLV